MEIEEKHCDICYSKDGAKSKSIGKCRQCLASVCADCDVTHRKRKGRGHTVIRQEDEVEPPAVKRRRLTFINYSLENYDHWYHLHCC